MADSSNPNSAASPNAYSAATAASVTAAATTAAANVSANAGQGNANNIVIALNNAFKLQTGDPLTGERMAQLLAANMNHIGELAKQGKLNPQQIQQLKDYAEKYKNSANANAANAVASTSSAASASSPAATATPKPAAATVPAATPAPVPATPQSAAFKTGSPAPILTSGTGNGYPISETLNTSNPGPVQWQTAQQARPTLTGGIASGRMSGTPAQIARPQDDVTMLSVDDNRSRRKNTPGEQSMRRSVQDLVSSIDPSVRIEPEVEDLLLQIADEFIDSVTNFGCRLAKHRGGDTLEVKDLQLHLERNHNIRIPGFASDDTRIALSQSTVVPPGGAAPAKKGTQSSSTTLRNHRLAQVQQAKREAKLI